MATSNNNPKQGNIANSLPSGQQGADQQASDASLNKPKLIGGGINLNHEHTGRDSKKIKFQNLAWLPIVEVQTLEGYEPIGGTDGEMRLYWSTDNFVTDPPAPAGAGLWLFIKGNGTWFGYYFTNAFV